MNKEQQAVKEFMVKAGQECPNKPTYPDIEVVRLRINLIQEELDELVDAFGDPDSCYKEPHNHDKVLMADAIADILVVTLGTAVACGIEIEPVFQEVMRSNMSKFIDGYRREDGKWMKGPSYSPANIKPIIEKQLI